MGQVIAFRTLARSARKSSETPSGDAQILFFLGVRYMRMDDALAARLSASAQKTRGGSGRRKRRSRA